MPESHFESNDRELLVKFNSDMEYMKTAITEIKVTIAEQNRVNRDNYVTKDEFLPVRNLIYGLVALVLTSVIGAVIAVVVKGGAK